MFTAAFMAAVLKMAIPALTALISMGASKYLEKRDRILLAMIVQLVSIAGIFVFYILPQLNILANSLTHLFNVEDLFSQSHASSIHDNPSWIAPIHDPSSVPAASIDNTPSTLHNDIKSIVPDGGGYQMTPDKNGYYTRLPYQDYFQPPRPIDMSPLYKDAAESTAKLLKPTLDVIKDTPQVDLNVWGHFREWVDGGLGVFKDILLK